MLFLHRPSMSNCAISTVVTVNIFAAATNIFPRLLQTQSWAVFQFARMSSSLSPLLLLPSFPFSPRSSTTHCSLSTALKYSQVAAQRCAAQLSDIQK